MTATHEGATVSNRYRILGRIARGGMADIYVALATNEAGVDRHVVLKRVLDSRARDEDFARMFLDEARLAAKLQHPNIAQVYDVGQLGGTYFYTMEYVHGEDVRRLMHVLKQNGSKMPIHIALYIACGALAALHHAHDRTTADGQPLGIVHRDVSPANVMIGFEGAVKLLDFGVAKAAQRSSETQSGSIKGKIAYLSPEQIKHVELDRRSDVFALGIVLHEMLTGRRLFKRDSDFLALMAISTEDVPAPSSLRPEISPQLNQIVMTALEKDRDRRYPSAAAMLEALEACATAERHPMSPSALAKFMREQIGVRPEPWVAMDGIDVSTALTFTTSNASGIAHASGNTVTSDLLKQLDHAADLRPAAPSFDSGPVSSPPKGARAPAVPAAPPRRRGRTIAILAIAMTVLGIAGAAAYWKYAIDLPQPDAHAPSVAAAPPPTAGTAGVPTPATTSAASAVPLPADASDSPPADASESTPPPDAAPPPDAVPGAKVPTIAELAARGDRAALLRACEASAATLAAAERRTCAIGACLTRHHAASLAYRKGLPPAEQTSIERTCHESAPQNSVPQPVQDPCKDPDYVEAHPLQCM